MPETNGKNTTAGCAEPAAYVGFANLPNQVHRKSVKKGFEFTLMVVGESGLGKSTLIDSLFLSNLYGDRKVPDAKGNTNTPTTGTGNGKFGGKYGISNGNGIGNTNGNGLGLGDQQKSITQQLLDKFNKNVQITAKTVDIEERGVKLRLTVVDTPGFGDALDNTDSFSSIIKYIDDQFEKYFQAERGLNRRNITDTRVHCCFYFISPWGRGLKPLDVEVMKQLHQKVNIVPIIAKADCLTKKEIADLKSNINKVIQANGISVYTLPEVEEDEDQSYKEEVRQLKEAMPFAVCSSTTIIEAGGKKVRGRLYPWGVVEIENPDHSDFVKLRTMVIAHMQDLQEVTQESHYENYRLQKLAADARAEAAASLNGSGVSTTSSGVSVVADEQLQRMLKEKDDELRKMHELMAKYQKS